MFLDFVTSKITLVDIHQKNMQCLRGHVGQYPNVFNLQRTMFVDGGENVPKLYRAHKYVVYFNNLYSTTKTIWIDNYK